MKCLSMPPPGYNVQRYGVSCLGFYLANPDERKVFRWTNEPDGGALVRMVEKHPSWHSPEVKDLKPEGDSNGN